METKRYLFKIGRRIHAYVDHGSTGWRAHTGKPSDACCLGWGPFPTSEEALAVAEKFMRNFCATPIGTVTYKIVEG